jgi:hypothetical protein
LTATKTIIGIGQPVPGPKTIIGISRISSLSIKLAKSNRNQKEYLEYLPVVPLSPEGTKYSSWCKNLDRRRGAKPSFFDRRV